MKSANIQYQRNMVLSHVQNYDFDFQWVRETYFW